MEKETPFKSSPFFFKYKYYICTSHLFEKIFSQLYRKTLIVKASNIYKNAETEKRARIVLTDPLSWGVNFTHLQGGFFLPSPKKSESHLNQPPGCFFRCDLFVSFREVWIYFFFGGEGRWEILVKKWSWKLEKQMFTTFLLFEGWIAAGLQFETHPKVGSRENSKMLLSSLKGPKAGGWFFDSEILTDMIFEISERCMCI